MLRIIADEKIPFLRGVLEPFAQVIYLPGSLITNQSVKNADAILIRTRTKCDRYLLERTSVKFIATATIGFDHIDTEYCNSMSIKWVNAPGCNSASVQQYVLAALFMIAQKSNFNLVERTVGIIGVGNVGSKIQAAAALLGIKVKLNDPPRARREGDAKFVSLDEILETCDIITLHVPLNKQGEDKTFHLFHKNIIAKMKGGAWLINTSRGEVVDTSAIREALSKGKLEGAVLDVWETEPQIDLELLRQVYISTPHIAGYSIDGKANGTAQVVQAVSRYFGLPIADFYPKPLPAPEFPQMGIDCTGKSLLQVVNQAIIHTYPIMEDHLRLQQAPETFELQRGNYPVRREFSTYKVKLFNGNPEATNLLSELGFNVISEYV